MSFFVSWGQRVSDLERYECIVKYSIIQVS